MRAIKRLCLLWFILFIASCGRETQPAPPPVWQDVFPDANLVPGWTRDGSVETYNTETLYDMVDGQADAFFAYNFEQVAW